jgi:hypothetical protein
MHHLPAEGNFCDENGNALKSAIVQDYNRHIRRQELPHDSYSISRHTWKWTKKLFFQRACNVTVGKFYKFFYFISIFIAQKLIIGLIIRYVAEQHTKNIPKSNTFTKTRTQGSFGFVTLVSVIFSPKQRILFFAPFFYLA